MLPTWARRQDRIDKIPDVNSKYRLIIRMYFQAVFRL
jgi:hypothetical protein